uniref:Neur_chan_LBD domain-containing protein n=1 Tax=Rhabditophanes sp. KR3021 TaxID=114890 RepID=A0AC35TYW3_9BILA
MHEVFYDPNNKLASLLRYNARPYRRPVLHPNDRLDVHVKASLYQVVDIDQRNNLATISGFFDVWWIDPFLVWNSTDYDNITNTFIPAKDIWKPEFYLYHSIQGRTPDYDREATAEVQNDGKVRMFVPITSRALCPINVKYFPFDTQNCSFMCGSWMYQSKYVKLVVDDTNVFLGGFYDSQEWLLEDGILRSNLMNYTGNETYSMVEMMLTLRRQSFYYVFNLVFPTTLVSLVAVVGFHAPINASGRRESKFRLGIMTLLSMSVMLLMLVDEMKFSLASIPGQRGSFSDVPLLGLYYMTLIFIISVATCTTSIFVHLEKYALRNQNFYAIPCCLRFLSGKKLFCCWVPKAIRVNKGDEIALSKNVKCNSHHSSMDSVKLIPAIPTEINFVDCGTTVPPENFDERLTQQLNNQQVDLQKIDLLITLMREFIDLKNKLQQRHVLPPYWERVIQRLEHISLSFYLLLIALDITLFLWPDMWY